MATTTPFPFGDYVHGDKPEARALIAEYESALADSDKAGETDTAAYHEGRTEAFADALFLLLDVSQEAWDRYQQGVSPANDEPDLPQIRILPSVMHIPNEHYAAAHDHMTGERDNRYGAYTLMSESGWQIYQGPRLVRLAVWDVNGTRVREDLVEHAQIMRLLQDHLDEIALDLGNPVDDEHYDVVEAALGLVLSDAQTGTSIMHWPVMNRLVDRALTAAMLGQTGHVTTEWEEF